MKKVLPNFRERKLEEKHSFVVFKTILITLSKSVKLGLLTIALVNNIV